MSDNLINESPEAQIDSAFKMIINAYYSKIQLLEKDISNLHNIIKNKDQKYFELEKILKIVDLDNKTYEEEIDKLQNENRRLNEIIHKLTEENKALSKFKQNVAASLETEGNNINFFSTFTSMNSNNQSIDEHKSKNLNNLIDNLNANNYVINNEKNINMSYIEKKINDMRGRMKLNIKSKSAFSPRTPDSEVRSNKSSQYVHVQKFFGECRNILKKNEYDELVQILSNKIEDNELGRVEEILSGQSKLINDFNRLYKS